MAEHKTFNFKTIEDLCRRAEEIGAELPVRENIESLFRNFSIGNKIVPNRIAVQPMEGFDGDPDGSPGELVFRRYKRFAEGGNGLIWFEATSIVPEGRSNPRQLLINEKNLDKFKELVESTRTSAQKTYGNSHDPFLVLQLTHSGRFSRPDGKHRPIALSHNPYLDKDKELVSIIDDDEMARLKETYIRAADLAYDAGFDSVDVKVCHGYLLHDLITSYKRQNSEYGGEELEKRTGFIKDIVKEISSGYPDKITSVRLNLYDGIPYPYGFGVPKNGTIDVDLSEPVQFIKDLVDSGCRLLNGTLGVGFHNPHVGRPYNRNVAGGKKPPEHPIEGVSRFINIVGAIQKQFPDLPVVGTGYSWLRHLFPYIGAAVLEARQASFIGLGRGAFAYPDAPKDLMHKGRMDPRKVCVACSSCTELMRGGHITGCIIRDREIYTKEFRKMKSSGDN
ncbi:MAG: hypothetical protein GY863_10110 [bacterium]|nr:hypothetical protein [bacterium]